MDVRNYPYLNDDHKDLLEAFRDFAQTRVAPLAQQIDEESRFPQELIEEMAQMGLFGLFIPQEYGGAGCDYLSYALAIEEISAACASTGVILSAHNSLACNPILLFGTEEQKKKFLQPLASGTMIGSFGLTESGAGSDSSGTRTSYKIQGNEVILNGTKNFITNGPQAGAIIVLATKDPKLQYKGISAFIAPKESFQVGKLEKKTWYLWFWNQ